MENNPFTPVGFNAGEFTYAQPNGEAVRAPLEFWVAAILSVLTSPQREEVLKRVELIKANRMTIKSSDGFPVQVSRID